MRALILFITCLTLSTEAWSECFNRETGTRPKEIEFANGEVIEILSYDKGLLHYKGFNADGEFQAQIVTEAGFRVLKTVNPKGTVVRTIWPDPLPDPDDLTVGSEINQKGMQIQPNWKMVEINTKVVGTETFTLGDCSYDVLVLEFRNGPENGSGSRGTRTYDPWTMLTYKSDFVFVAEDGTTTQFGSHVVRME
jgi:hypothetical protein